MPRPRLGNTPTIRVQLVITVGDVSDVDDFMFRNRIRSRSEAIRLLIKRGLDAPGMLRALSAVHEANISEAPYEEWIQLEDHAAEMVEMALATSLEMQQ
jgi:hypothetical protein